MRVEAAGQAIVLGDTETTPTIGITDYSRRVTDDFGVTTVVERKFARRLSVRLALPSDQVDTVHARLTSLRASTALWVADDRFASLSVAGFYKDFTIDIPGAAVSFCTLTVEGLAEAGENPDLAGDPAPDAVSSTLRLIQPADVTDAALVAINVPENDAPAWGAGVSYAAGAKVARQHRVYESLIAANTSDPAAASGTWLDTGPTNRWAMFDQALGTSTTAAGSIVATLNVGGVDAVALLDTAGDTVRVQGAGYDRTQPVGTGSVTFLDMPLSAGPVTITVAGSGQVAVGTLLVGRLSMLGVTEASPTAAITDYSRKEVDDFGDVTIVERAWAKRMDARSIIRTDAIDKVFGRLAAVRARPSLWIGQDGVESLTIYGFFKDFSIEVGPHVSKLSLSIEGLSKAPPVGTPLKDRLDSIDGRIDDALGLAGGKAEIFFRDAAPSAAESRANDLWINGTGRVFRRVAGSGALAIGGKRILLAGAAVLLPWTLADDQRIGAALVAAGAAQATAERKTETYISETQPTDGTYGDLWFKPSTQALRTFNGSAWVLSSTVGALPEQIDAIEAATDLAGEAKTIADGKARLFYRPTAPAAAEASEGDRWVNTGAGNVEYRRLPGSGQIVLAGKRVLLGGSAIALPWTRADDQRIAASLAAAAGAQATADGKIETYFAETAPIADGVGDLWYRPSTKELRRWSGSGWDLVSTVGATDAQLTLISDALTAANNARAVADGKIAAFYQPTAPAEADEGDLWIDTDDGNKLYRFDGALWVLTRDTGITAALNAASGAQTTADKKVTTFVGEAAPVAEATGDLWYRSSTKEFRRWDGDSWDVVSTVGATQDQVDAIDAKSRTFRQAVAPSAADSKGGDLWINTAAGNRTYQRLNGSGQLAIGSMRVVLVGKTVLLPWTLAADQRIEDTAAQAAASAAALAAAQARLAAVASDASEAKAIADGKIDSFWQPSPPVGASEGDFWIDTDDNRKLYRFTGGAWALARDAGIVQAISAASDAQSTADGKVTSFIQATPPVAEGEGDFWYDTATGRLKRWSGMEWVATADDTAANQHSMQDLGAVVFTYNADGTPGAPGQFPTTALSSRLLGQQDVSPWAEWSLDVPSGVNAAINNVSGALQRGLITIDAPFTVEAATVVVRSTYEGVAVTKLLQIRKGYTSAPATGGGGSGSGSSATPGNPASATSFTSPESSLTRVVMATLPAVAVGGSGTVRLSTSLTFTVAPGDEGDLGYLHGIWAYSTNGGGAWSDVGSATMSSGASNYFSLEMPKGPRSEPGSLEVNVDKTGLTGGASVIFRLEGFSSGRYVASVTGSATAKPL